MVGFREEERPAVYHVALYLWNSGQKVVALNFGGMITVPPEWRGARNPASRPWTWNSGITRYDRSDSVSLYVLTIFFIVLVKFRCVNGTAAISPIKLKVPFGRPVVPLVCNTS